MRTLECCSLGLDHLRGFSSSPAYLSSLHRRCAALRRGTHDRQIHNSSFRCSSERKNNNFLTSITTHPIYYPPFYGGEYILMYVPLHRFCHTSPENYTQVRTREEKTPTHSVRGTISPANVRVKTAPCVSGALSGLPWKPLILPNGRLTYLPPHTPRFVSTCLEVKLPAMSAGNYFKLPAMGADNCFSDLS